MTIDKDGTVVEGKDIRGCVTIAADNVTIRRSKISCSNENGAVVKIQGSPKDVLLEDVEIDGLGESSNGIGSDNVVVRRANIHSSVDGVRAGRNFVLEDSYIHHLARLPETHNDAVQTVTGANIIIRYNNLQAYNPDTRDPLNAAYMFGPSVGPVSNIQFYGNLVNGGNYTINGGGDVTDVVFRDNQFQRDFRYGPVRVEGPVVFDDSNVWADNGEPVR